MNAADPVDVLVVGAGPAGSATATCARRHGLSVMLVDRAAAGRDKCCGDGLTAMALRELEHLGFGTRGLDSWTPIAAARLRTPSGRTMRLPLPAGRGQFAAVCRRAELDAALVDLAAESGADVRHEVGFEGFETGNGVTGVTVNLSDGSGVQARFLVAADGVYSAVRKALGLGPQRYRGDWHAFRGYLRADGAAAADLCVWFEPDLLPGYAWSFPLGDGRVNFGFGLPRASGELRGGEDHTGSLRGSELASIWAGLAERPHIAQDLGSTEADGPTRAWPIGARLGGITLASGRTLLCGDAGAAADPLTGEGIGQALQMGRLAAEAIARGGPPHSVAKRYGRNVRTSFDLDHRLANLLSRVLSGQRRAELALGAVDTCNWTRAQFARWMFEDYPRAALASPQRWSREFLSGIFRASGAYATPAEQPAKQPIGA